MLFLILTTDLVIYTYIFVTMYQYFIFTIYPFKYKILHQTTEEVYKILIRIAIVVALITLVNYCWVLKRVCYSHWWVLLKSLMRFVESCQSGVLLKSKLKSLMDLAEVVSVFVEVADGSCWSSRFLSLKLQLSSVIWCKLWVSRSGSDLVLLPIK